MAKQEKPKNTETGLSITTYWNIHVPKELIKELAPWLISGIALLTGSGLLLSSNLSSSDQITPAPIEARE